MIVHGASNSSAKLRLGWQNDSDALVSKTELLVNFHNFSKKKEKKKKE